MHKKLRFESLVWFGELRVEKEMEMILGREEIPGRLVGFFRCGLWHFARDTSSDGCCARLFDLWDMWVRFWWRSALLVCYHVFDISCLRTAEEGIAVDDYVLGKMRATKWDDRTTQLPI